MEVMIMVWLENWMWKYVFERSERLNYWLFDSKHHLNVTRSTVSIRNTLFCHFPVTMVTHCEMCFSMYVLVPTRTVCQWSIFFLFFLPHDLKRQWSALAANLWIFSQQDKLGVDWLLSRFTVIETRSHEEDALSFSLPLSLSVTFYKQYSKKHRQPEFNILQLHKLRKSEDF